MPFSGPGEYLFRILRRPLKLPKTHRPNIEGKNRGGAKMFKGSYLHRDNDFGAKVLWAFITPTVDCFKKLSNKSEWITVKKN